MIIGVIIGVLALLPIIYYQDGFHLKVQIKMNYLKKYNLGNINGMAIREKKFQSKPKILLNNYFQKNQKKGLQQNPR